MVKVTGRYGAVIFHWLTLGAHCSTGTHAWQMNQRLDESQGGELLSGLMERGLGGWLRSYGHASPKFTNIESVLLVTVYITPVLSCLLSVTACIAAGGRASDGAVAAAVAWVPVFSVGVAAIAAALVLVGRYRVVRHKLYWC